jgi:thioesterase domain-containing protein
MERYDPLQAPASKEWLELDESERIALIESYHHRTRAVLPDLRAHATFQAIVENQAALGDETPVRRTLARLMEEGVDRHEAIHAVVATLAEHVFDLVRAPSPPSDPNASYFAALEKLTVESWRKNYG